WAFYQVRPGDNLSKLMTRAGFSDREAFLASEIPDNTLVQLFPGQMLGFATQANGQLAEIRHKLSALKSMRYIQEDGNFTAERETRQPTARIVEKSVVINSSLFLAGQASGLSDNLIMELANLFAGVIDFVLDPRQGDRLNVIYEALYLDEQYYSDGDIIAAAFTNKGETFTAYRYVDSEGRISYFNERGESMRKAFLMAPLDFTRISSNFNPRRVHPVYKTSRPHRGTDYAAPTGTPVFAAGDGRVIEAAYNRANGNYVFIQHGERYITKYLHLHRLSVKQGQRVSQSQIIGTVGATGTATGPHLHYEFLVNGVHQNPRTIHKNLPKAKSLSATEMPRFLAQVRPQKAELAQLIAQQEAQRLAQLDTSE
ncbi:MAG: peptidoglycan DD-metalloendopeptidase family protein, partial [Proteobacteria bacterium]|nr:peptidoglycan DD-metalloendopeptidase family protein [Pseudomonadota bacterium]